MNEQSLALTVGFAALAENLARVFAEVAAETVEASSLRMAAE